MHAYQNNRNGPYLGWEPFGGPGTNIQAVNNADGRLDVFGTSAAGVFHKWQTGFASWSEWDTLAGSPGPSVP